MDTAIATAEAVGNGDLTAVESTQAALDRIDRHNGTLDAFTLVDHPRALADARRVDERLAQGEELPLAGVPIGVKELDHVAGWPDNDGTDIFADRLAERDDTHIARLREAGAVLVGLTSASEFGITAYTHHPVRGITARNPWDLSRSPGGSSGGSAAAVAAGLIPLATGGDGGGSIRLPAALCGLVGPKMAVGRTPREARDLWETAVLGPLATNVADAARYLDVTVGPDGIDRNELPHPGVSYEASLDQAPPSGLRAAWIDTFGYGAVESEVIEHAHAAASALADEVGLEMVDRPIRFRDPSTAWSIIGAVGFLRDIGDPADIDPSRLSVEGRWSLEGSPHVTASDLARAVHRISAAVAEIEKALTEVDVILSPAAAVSSVPAEGPLPTTIEGVECRPPNIAQFTIPFNLSGHPAFSVPAGRTSDGHPVGLQIAAGRFQEALLFRLAAAYERLRPWPRTAPLPDD